MTRGGWLDRLTLPRAVVLILAGVVLLAASDKAGLLRDRPVRPPASAAPVAVASREAPISMLALRVLPDAPVETPEVFPPGAGRDEAFYACTACHGSRIVTQQGLSRDRWEASLDWMVERHGMAPLDPAERALVLDYLAASFPGRQRRALANPFLK